jgi:uncharacterized membrane protein
MNLPTALILMVLMASLAGIEVGNLVAVCSYAVGECTAIAQYSGYVLLFIAGCGACFYLIWQLSRGERS